MREAEQADFRLGQYAAVDHALEFVAHTVHWSKTFDASGETVWKGHGVYIELDGMTYLELFESAAATDAGSESDHTAPAAMQHIGLIVPSVDDAYQACLAAGGETSAVGDWDGSPVGVTLNGDPETHVRVAFVQGPLASSSNSTSSTAPSSPTDSPDNPLAHTTTPDESLKRLRTDYIDLLWVHAHDALTPVPEIMRALDDQVLAGKIRYVGASNWPAWEVAEANTLADLRGWSAFASLEIRYNLLGRGPERDLLPMARRFDLPVLSWGALAEGRLTGKYLAGGTGRLTVQPRLHSSAGSDETVRTVVDIAEAGGWTPAQVALAWLRTRPGAVVIPILGATREAQLADSLGCTEVELDDKQLARLDELTRPELGYPHDLMCDEITLRDMYGANWRDIQDRRFTVRRGVADDAYHPLAR